MNTLDGYSSDFETYDFLFDIQAVLKERYNFVKYISHKNQRLSLKEYEVILCSLRGCSHEKITREIYNDCLVGEGWWYVFSAVCCTDPFWNLYIHPDYK